jgi:hypothetical protein
MKTFIEEVVFDYWSKEKSFDQTLFLIPSKRSGVFLKKQMGLTAQKTIFSPSVMTIEEFVEKLSQLRLMDTLELTLNLFETQKEVLTTPDSFEAFMSWGPTLLQDIIEIDRYLVDAQKVFSYLSEIQNIDHWYLSNQKTQLIKEYLLFWKSLPTIQAAFEEKLLKQKAGHQGLLYKKALNNAFDYIQKAQIKKVVIMGFNAHNKAEIELFKILDSKTQCTFYWDVDPHFLNDSIHDAGFFIRKHQKSWAQKVNSINLGKGYLEKKNIEIIGVPKKVSQAKYVAQILKENNVQHSNMALVLADEALLNPILNAIPDQVSKANITMGYPLNKSPFFGLFLKLFAIYLHKNDKGYYHKNLNQFCQSLCFLNLLGAYL